MAYLVGTTQTAKQPTGTSYAVTFPSGVAAGDLLLVLLSQDGSTESLGVSASGFTALGGTQTESGACSSLWFYKIAAGGETTATFACANDDIIGTAMLWRDAHATAPFGATPTSGTNFVRTDWTGVASAASGSLTPPEDDCTLVYAWCADGNTTYMRTQLSECVNIDAFASDAIGHIIGYRQQGTAAAAPTVTMYANIATEGGNGWVLAIRNKSGGALSPTVLGGTNEIQWYGSWSSVGGVTGATLVPANWTALSGFAASINGISTATTIGDGTSTNAVGSTNTPLNVTLWGLVSRVTMTDNTAGNWSGGRHPINSIDLTGKIVSVQASMDIVTPTRFGPNGLAIVFGDAGGNWVAYKLAERTGLVGGLSYTFHVAPGQGTALDSSGDIATTLSAVTQVGYMVHRIGSSASANVLTVFNLTVSDTATITGGGNSDATSSKFSNMYFPFKRFNFGDMNQLQASAQTMAKTTVQIGDGDTPTYFDATASSFEFPPTYSATYGVANTQNTWNVTANDVGLTIKAAAGDTINMTAAVIATVTEQPLTIHADCDVSAVSFAGSSIVGYTVTDNAGLSWSSATFKSGGTVTIAGGGDLTNCAISKTTSANAALAITANGSTLDGCTVDGTGAAYALELGTAVTAVTLTDCTLTAGSTDKAHTLKTAATVTAGAFVTGDHYEIKTVGTTDFTLIGASANTIGVRFTAAGAGSGTGDAYVAVKITISGTTSLAESDVTSAGAVVWVAAPEIYQVVNITNLVTGSRVQIYDTTNAVELANELASGSTVTWTDPTPYAADRDIRVRIAYVSGVTAKQFIEAEIGTVGDGSPNSEVLTYRANQVDDAEYNANGLNGSTIYGAGEITFTDSSTDVINMDMATNTISLQTQYAAWVYYAFTETGITTDIDYINAIDPANYEFSGIQWKNTSSPTAPLKITGGYAWDATTLDPMDLIDDTGGTIFLTPPHVVSYQTSGDVVISGNISTVLAAIPSASANATEVWSNSKALTVPKFLGLK